MGEMTRAPMGEKGQWPQSLRTAVSIRLVKHAYGREGPVAPELDAYSG